MDSRRDWNGPKKSVPSSPNSSPSVEEWKVGKSVWYITDSMSKHKRESIKYQLRCTWCCLLLHMELSLSVDCNKTFSNFISFQSSSSCSCLSFIESKQDEEEEEELEIAEERRKCSWEINDDDGGYLLFAYLIQCKYAQNFSSFHHLPAPQKSNHTVRITIWNLISLRSTGKLIETFSFWSLVLYMNILWRISEASEMFGVPLKQTGCLRVIHKHFVFSKLKKNVEEKKCQNVKLCGDDRYR